MTTMLFSSLYLLLQWSFDEGMLNYVNQRELQNLELLANNLNKIHNEIGDLRLLQTKPIWWHATINASMQGITLSDNPIQTFSPNKYELPPHFNNDHHRKNKPPRHNASGHFSPSEKHNRPKRELRERLDRTIFSRDFKRNRMPILLDKDKESIFGHYRTNFNLRAIQDDNNEIIAYLALPPAQKLTSSFDLAFSDSQRTTWLIILAGMFGVTFIVAVFLSRYLIKGVQTLAQATNQLNKGDYTVQLSPKGNDELASLARDFNDLAQTLSHNDTTRKAWLADISHELRTPLAIVKGEIEALQDGIRKVTPDSLQSLADEVHHLQKLIDDLNQLTNADIGALNYQKSTINLSNTLNQNIQRRASTIKSQGLLLTCEISEDNLQIWADETRLNQLFDNLITNSLKYTDAPGLIHVTLTKDGRQAILIFEDSSPSVPEAAMSKLFDHLFRVESSRNRKTGGSGLGLALCQKIVHAHQGEISAYTAKQGGLGIKISLPLI